jgi:hypothetical protein
MLKSRFNALSAPLAGLCAIVCRRKLGIRFYLQSGKAAAVIPFILFCIRMTSFVAITPLLLNRSSHHPGESRFASVPG